MCGLRLSLSSGMSQHVICQMPANVCNLQTETASSSEQLVYIYQTARHHNNTVRIFTHVETLNLTLKQVYCCDWFSFSTTLRLVQGGGSATGLQAARSGVTGCTVRGYWLHGPVRGYRLHGPVRGSKPSRGNVFLFTQTSRLALRSTQSPVVLRQQMVIKWPRCDRHHSPSPAAEVKNTWSYTSTSSQCRKGDVQCGQRRGPSGRI